MGRLIDYKIEAFDYLDYLPLAIRNNTNFKYSEVNQITARYAGKTVAGTIAIIKCIVEARRAKKKLVVYQFRMRHNDTDKLWNETITWLNYYCIPYFTRKSEGLIKALSTDIYIKGAYVSNSNKISMVGTQGAYSSNAIIIFEEAYEFDEKTIPATIRNLVHQESIEVPIEKLLKNTIKVLRGKLMQPWDLAPFAKGYILS